jgi:hypothetical protein
MPPLNLSRSVPRATGRSLGTATQSLAGPSQSSVASTPSTSASYSSLVSLSTDVDADVEIDDFAMIERVASQQSISTQVTDDALASEFDFMDESEDDSNAQVGQSSSHEQLGQNSGPLRGIPKRKRDGEI